MSNTIYMDATFYSEEQSRWPDGHIQPPATGMFGITLEQALNGQSGYVQCSVDPNVIRFYTRFLLYLPSIGSTVWAQALDRGGAIIGTRIDIYVKTNNSAISYGGYYGHVNVVAYNFQ